MIMVICNMEIPNMVVIYMVVDNGSKYMVVDMNNKIRPDMVGNLSCRIIQSYELGQENCFETITRTKLGGINGI